ncbi:MAG: PQQ-binding-like beta-propeller repeat protein, partial [Sulfuricaulis sp.]|nr:PQQ-binding-like beta-propeller repeat protein [Sulfuricaulis sp.]
MIKLTRTAAPLLAVVALVPTLVSASEWRQFRGPDGQGIGASLGLPLTWSADQNVAWKTSLPGPGGSSPIVFGDRIYVTCFSG